MHEIELTTAEDGQRLDRYLRKLLPETPLGAIFKMLRVGHIRVDGKKAKQDLRLVAGMRVTLPESSLPAAAATPTGSFRGPLPRVVHQDDDLLVVDKPAGLAAQPGSGNEHNLLTWLDQQDLGTRTATFRPAPAHRLDRGTSGLLLVGLSPIAARALSAAFRADQVAKGYVAVVEGVVEPAAGTIDAPLLLRENARHHQPKVSVDARGKRARTDYQVVEQGRSCALLELTLHTGRTHQIRAHLAHLGHPIVGDRRYGSKVDRGHGVFFLHAAELSVPHPVSGELLRFTSPVPAHFRAALHHK